MNSPEIEPNQPPVLGIAFMLSLAINAGVILAMDRGVYLQQNELVEKIRLRQAQKSKNIEFEFVESPVKTRPEKPRKTPKISDRDSLAQDTLSKKVRRSTAPHIRKKGPSDQLTQVRGAPAKSLPLKPSSATPPKPPEAQPKEAAKPTAPQAPAEAKPGSEAPQDKSVVKDVQPQEKQPEPKKSSPAAKPEGLTGQDKITTQQMARTRSFGALLEGMTSFEATGSGMGVYMKNIKEKVWMSWFPYLAFHYPQDYRSADAVVGFVLDKDGNVKIVQVLESYGSPVFAAFCMEAVQKASGFGPVPQEVLALTGKDEVEIKFGFHYR